MADLDFFNHNAAIKFPLSVGPTAAEQTEDFLPSSQIGCLAPILQSLVAVLNGAKTIFTVTMQFNQFIDSFEGPTEDGYRIVDGAGGIFSYRLSYPVYSFNGATLQIALVAYNSGGSPTNSFSYFALPDVGMPSQTDIITVCGAQSVPAYLNLPLTFFPPSTYIWP